MPEVLILQHVAPEPPGTIGAACRELGHTLRTVRVHEGDPVPSELGEAAALVVMGGPMGVYDTDAYPHLNDEIRLIEEALRRERPVLGVCLGSQLLAATLGAEVRSGGTKEIGWHEVTLTEAAGEDTLWSNVDDQFMAYHWHGDVFDLPEGGVCLARSEQTECQAFRYGECAYGILFHMEVTPHIVDGMTEAFADELQAEGLSGEIIQKGAEAHLSDLQTVGHQVFRQWVDLIHKP